MAQRPPLSIGELGEHLVSQWLTQQGWTVLYHRWHSRWGEIDLIAQQPPLMGQKTGSLVFVEVKTRSRGNWDEDGRLAVTPQKQEKLWQTAEMFLGKHPQWMDWPCRFDLALVRYKPTQRQEQSGATIALGRPYVWSGYEWRLQEYLEGVLMGE
ncbi:YraN family protein [Spirulina sp. CS-785/01]|uniref:YraN family protein n=1 Tax=Spirulina sp. CS-785/01 TaxID=3021716 RepID=UPI00232CF6A1|nr:YraN family protein [Spirulina sp. CS-785/01]MDB9315325.1 YraN family protein [Spirulina sp. CS-785/01]